MNNFVQKGKKDLSRSPTKISKATINTNSKFNGQFQQLPQSQPLQQQQHNYSELNNNSNNRFNQNQGDEIRKRAQTLQSFSSGSERQVIYKMK